MLRWKVFKNNDPESMFEMFTKTTSERPQTVFDHMKDLGSEKSGGPKKDKTEIYIQEKVLFHELYLLSIFKNH